MSSKPRKMNCKALLNIAIEIALYKCCIIIIIIIMKTNFSLAVNVGC